MPTRAYNFNAGPSALPIEVLQQAAEEFIEFKDSGMSLMEMSHRGKIYDTVHEETIALFRELMNIPDNYKVMFLQGGGSTQFAMVPMNLAVNGKVGQYVVTGSWAKKAYEEAVHVASAKVVAKAEEGFVKVPDLSQLQLDENAAYLHVTSNETIEGVQYKSFPNLANVPLIADMSSDILSYPIDVSKFGLIYAGAQKNLGPSGVTVVIIREDLLEGIPASLPTMLNYKTYADSDSLYNTPPVYSIYMMNLVLKWIKGKGGAAAIASLNQEKASLIYNQIDASEGFYRCPVQASDRSLMNITFRLADEELEKKFIKESEQAGFVGLKGHRSVGGLRASTYNSVTLASCQALADFMRQFRAEHQA